MVRDFPVGYLRFLLSLPGRTPATGRFRVDTCRTGFRSYRPEAVIHQVLDISTIADDQAAMNI